MASAFILHPYQQEALRELLDHHQRLHRILLSLPTGTGKTLVAARYIGTNFTAVGRRTVWIAHSQELLDQAYETFTEKLGLDGSLVARRYAHHHELRKKKQALVWLMNNAVQEGPDDPDLVVIDEAHHAAAASYTDWLSTYRAFAPDGAKVLGLTATPYRLERGDVIPLTSFGFSKPRVPIFEKIAYQRSFCDLAASGYIAPFRHISYDTKMHFRMSLGATRDFDGESLESLNTKGRNQFIVDRWRERRKEFGKTLVFVGTQKHARGLAKLFGDEADYVVSDHEKDLRTDVVARFRAGKLSVLVNVGIFKEGVDVPDIRTVILARPTTSPVLFTQMVGRGSRVLPDKKFFYLVDIHDQLDDYEHYLAGVLDLADRSADLVEAVSRRGDAAEKLGALRVKSLVNDKTVLADVLSVEPSEVLRKFAGWITFEGEREEPLPIGALLTADEMGALTGHVDEQGRVASDHAAMVEQHATRFGSDSLRKAGRALRGGLVGRLKALTQSDVQELVELKENAPSATGLSRDAPLATLVEKMRHLSTQARAWGAPELNIGRLIEEYTTHPERYAALVKLTSAAGPYVRLVTESVLGIINETAAKLREGALGFADAPAVGDKLVAAEPDLEGHAMRLVDAIAKAQTIDTFCVLLN